MKQLDLQDSGEIKDMVEITVRVDFDSIDKAILNIFNRYPGRSYKVSQILSILLYQGIKINSAIVARRLDVFCSLTILSKERRTGRVNRYMLQ